jgi:E3 ubiquitin-protein ligase BRE1
VRELTKALDNSKKESAGYMAEIELIAKEFESMQEQNARLVLQLSEKDDANTKLMSERIKSEQQQHLLREEGKTLAAQLKVAGEVAAAQKDLLLKEEAKVRSLEEQLLKANEQLALLNSTIELHKRTARDSAQQMIDLRAKLEFTTKTMEDLKKKVEEQTAVLEREEEHSSRLLEERNVLKRKLERLATRTADSLIEEELASVKKMLRCPVCDDRMKDTVITRCYHVFCNECVRNRLAVRNRKCPTCARSFGESDVHSIYLNLTKDD